MPSVSQAMAWMPGRACSASASPSRNSLLRPPRPWVPDGSVTVVSPPESSTQGGGTGRPCTAQLAATPASTRAASRASPSIMSPRMSGVMPRSRASRAAASREARALATMRVSARARRASPGWASRLADRRARRARVRHAHVVAGEDRERLFTRARVRHRGAAGNHRRVVAGHVGDGQRQDGRRPGGGRQPPALHRRQVFAHAVHGTDGRAARKQRAADGLLVRQRDAWRRQRQQRRAAAGDQRDHPVMLGESAHRLEDAPCRASPAASARKGRLDDCDVPASNPVPDSA